MKIIDDVCGQVADIYSRLRARKIKNRLNREDGTKKQVDTYTVVLRKIGTSIYQHN